jgi:hypothetical protein
MSNLITNLVIKTNAEILPDMRYTKGRSWTGGIGQGKETKNLNVVDVLSVQEWIEKPYTGGGHHGKGLGSSKAMKLKRWTNWGCNT